MTTPWIIIIPVLVVVIYGIPTDDLKSDQDTITQIENLKDGISSLKSAISAFNLNSTINTGQPSMNDNQTLEANETNNVHTLGTGLLSAENDGEPLNGTDAIEHDIENGSMDYGFGINLAQDATKNSTEKESSAKSSNKTSTSNPNTNPDGEEREIVEKMLVDDIIESNKLDTNQKGVKNGSLSFNSSELGTMLSNTTNTNKSNNIDFNENSLNPNNDNTSDNQVLGDEKSNDLVSENQTEKSENKIKETSFSNSQPENFKETNISEIKPKDSSAVTSEPNSESVTEELPSDYILVDDESMMHTTLSGNQDELKNDDINNTNKSSEDTNPKSNMEGDKDTSDVNQDNSENITKANGSEIKKSTENQNISTVENISNDTELEELTKSTPKELETKDVESSANDENESTSDSIADGEITNSSTGNKIEAVPSKTELPKSTQINSTITKASTTMSKADNESNVLPTKESTGDSTDPEDTIDEPSDNKMTISPEIQKLNQSKPNESSGDKTNSNHASFPNDSISDEDFKNTPSIKDLLTNIKDEISELISILEKFKKTLDSILS